MKRKRDRWQLAAGRTHMASVLRFYMPRQVGTAEMSIFHVKISKCCWRCWYRGIRDEAQNQAGRETERERDGHRQHSVLVFCGGIGGGGSPPLGCWSTHTYV